MLPGQDSNGLLLLLTMLRYCLSIFVSRGYAQCTRSPQVYVLIARPNAFFKIHWRSIVRPNAHLHLDCRSIRSSGYHVTNSRSSKVPKIPVRSRNARIPVPVPQRWENDPNPRILYSSLTNRFQSLISKVCRICCLMAAAASMSGPCLAREKSTSSLTYSPGTWGTLTVMTMSVFCCVRRTRMRTMAVKSGCGRRDDGSGAGCWVATRV